MKIILEDQAYDIDDDTAKKRLIEYLNAGYSPYAELLELLPFHLTDEGGAAFMDPSTGAIYINKAVTDVRDQSWLVRHELLHYILAHERRMLVELAKKEDKLWFDLTPEEQDQFKHKLYKNRDPRMFRGWMNAPLSNFAADFEVCDIGYSDDDLDRIRKFKINGQLAKGLITADDRPDLLNKSVEYILNQLMLEEQNLPSSNNTVKYGVKVDDVTFKDMSGTIYVDDVDRTITNNKQLPVGKYKYKVYRGSFKDANTFLDPSGTPYTLGEWQIHTKSAEDDLDKQPLNKKVIYADYNTSSCYKFNGKKLVQIPTPSRVKF